MKKKKVGTDILEKLKEIELKLPIQKYMFFSKSGFTDELEKQSLEDKSIVLIEKIL